MCGRYVNVASTGDLAAEFDVEETIGEDLPASWNIAPTDPVRAVMRRRPHGGDRDAETVRQLRTVRWGLVPTWSKTRDSGARIINARIETVTTKPAFKAAAARRRCLCPSLGYYEWQRTDEGKVPYFLHDPHRRPLAFAGLYEIWRDPARPDRDPSKWLWTCTIITQPATDALGQIHDRSPVIVPIEMHDAWLDCSSNDTETVRQLLEEIPEAHLTPDVVSAAVGNVANNGPELIEAVPSGHRPEQERLQL
ncbi:MAG: SOS response-associated peptidase [Mycobacteriales bacterium]